MTDAQDWNEVHEVVTKASGRVVKVVAILIVSVGLDLLLSVGLVVALAKNADTAHHLKELVKHRCEDNNADSQHQHDLWDPIIAQSIAASQDDAARMRAQAFKDSIDRAYTTTDCEAIK